MALDTPILRKTYDFYKLLCKYRNLVTRSERYALWLKCENATLEIIESLIEVSHQDGEDSKASLYKISDKVDFLKIFMRLAKDTQAINHDQYLEIERSLQEIGKMTGGWLKALK
jgi:hypothetical protein